MKKLCGLICGLLVLSLLAGCSIRGATRAAMRSGKKRSGSNTESACVSNLKNLATATEMWSSDHQGRYPKALSELPPNDKQQFKIQCPTTGKDYSYEVAERPDNYTMICQGDHTGEGFPAGFPRYTATVGLVKE